MDIKINNTNTVKRQYENSSNLDIRIAIHNKYSVNKQGFANWIVSNYRIKPKNRILELGCGTGSMWKSHLDLLEPCSDLTLTDLSEGMIASAKENLGDAENIAYRIADIQDIPFGDNCFDIVIANMMLYHVPDIKKGLSEVSRVLKDGGFFYCATYGEHGILDYLESMLGSFCIADKQNKVFTLQNGKSILSDYFVGVTRLDYPDSLEITDIDDVIEYIKSCADMTALTNMGYEDMKKILKNSMTDGVLHIPKEYGMFVCR